MRGEHDTFGSMAAGGLTGALYKSTGTLLFLFSFFLSLTYPALLLAGVRPAFVAATFMSAVAGLWSYAKRNV